MIVSLDQVVIKNMIYFHIQNIFHQVMIANNKIKQQDQMLIIVNKHLNWLILKLYRSRVRR